MAKIIYVAIGNEILMGKTINTNESFIGSRLTSVGIPLETSLIIKDDKEIILKTFKNYWEHYDVIIVTGGLGPTHDDVTKYAICKFFKKELRFDSSVWEAIQKMYSMKDIPIPEIVKTQAEIPQDFTPLPNKKGTAPGLYYLANNKHFFALPGVPSEMKSMFVDHVIPILQRNLSTHPVFQKTIRTIGIPESVLYTDTKNVHETARTKIAFLPKPGMVDIRVYGTSEQEVKDIISRLLENIPAENIYAFDENTIEETFHKKMVASGKTVSAAESCTGGLIQSLITNNAGSSEYFLGGVVSYSNEAKMKLLGVKESTLEKFGAVSEEMVREMLLGVQKLIGSDYAIAVSGIAGPDGGTEDKPVGLVYIGTFGKSGLVITKNNFSGTRIEVKKKTALMALHQLEI
ncbi:CinA family nicotinamide mononucleotide deamidase-related protein [bacterium]|nr:MAG: CinA family nicotinamide mononucleotide deamidase-related protein [bacterium]